MSIEFFHQPTLINNEHYLVLGVLEVKKDTVVYCVRGSNASKLTVEEYKKENFSDEQWEKIELEMTLLEQRQSELSSICSVVEVTINPKTIYLAKKYDPEYVTLEEYMQDQQHLKWSQIVEIVDVACEKLERLHDYMQKMKPGIVHQSLSPRSFLIHATKMRYKNELDLLVKEGFIYQSPDPYYSAPEQKMSEDSPLHRGVGSSVYSMGLIVFRMLTGKHLWEVLSQKSIQKKTNLSFQKDIVDDIWAERIIQDAPETLMNSLFWGASESDSIFYLDVAKREKAFPSLSKVSETLKNIQEGDVDVPLLDWTLQANETEREAIAILIARYVQDLCASKKYANIKLSPYSIYVNQKNIAKVLKERRSGGRMWFSSVNSHLLGRTFTIKDQSSPEQKVYASLKQLQNQHSYENVLYSFSLLLGFLLTKEPFGLEKENHLEQKKSEDYDFEKISDEEGTSDWERVFRRGLGVPLEGDAYQYTDLIEFVMDLSKGLPPIGLISLRQYRKLGLFSPEMTLELAEFFSLKDNVPNQATPDSIFIKQTSEGLKFVCDETYIDSRHRKLLIQKSMSDVYRLGIVGLWGLFGDAGFTESNERLSPDHKKMIELQNQESSDCPDWLFEVLIISIAKISTQRWRSPGDFWARVTGKGIEKYCDGRSALKYWSYINKKIHSGTLDENTNIARDHLGWATSGRYGRPEIYNMPISEQISRFVQKFMPFIVFAALIVIGMIAYPFLVPSIPTFSIDESLTEEEQSSALAQKILNELNKQDDPVWFCRGLARGNLITVQESRAGIPSPLDYCMKAATSSKNSNDFAYWFEWYPLAVEKNRVSLPNFWKNTFDICSEKTEVTNCKDKKQRCIYVRESIRKKKLIQLPEKCDEPRFSIATEYLEEIIQE